MSVSSSRGRSASSSSKAPSRAESAAPRDGGSKASSTPSPSTERVADPPARKAADAETQGASRTLAARDTRSNAVAQRVSGSFPTLAGASAGAGARPATASAGAQVGAPSSSSPGAFAGASAGAGARPATASAGAQVGAPSSSSPGVLAGASAGAGAQVNSGAVVQGTSSGAAAAAQGGTTIHATPAEAAARQAEATAALAAGDVEKAIELGLQNPGDEMRVSIAANGSIGMGGYLGAEGGTEAILRKTESGYELQVTGEAALTLGGEALGGNEAQAKLGGSVSPIYSFDSPAAAAKGVQAVAVTAAQTAAAANPNAVIGQGASGVIGMAAQASGMFNGQSAQGYLNSHMTGVELAGEQALTVAANLVPVVELRGTGANAEVGASDETTVRIDFPRDGQPTTVTITNEKAVSLEANAGFGVGVEAQGTTGVRTSWKFEVNGINTPEQLGGFAAGGITLDARLVESKAELFMEGSLNGTAGPNVGAVAFTGVTFNYSAAISPQQAAELAQRGIQQSLGGTPEGFFRYASSHGVELSGGMGLQTGAGFGLDISVAGNGGGLEAEAAIETAMAEDKGIITYAQFMDAARRAQDLRHGLP